MLQKAILHKYVQVPEKDIGSIEWDAGSWRSTTLLTAFGWRSYSVNYFALLFSILLCSALLLLYFALLCPILPCSTLLCSSEPLCQLPANHRLTCKKPPPIEFPGFFLWLAGSPYLASQCLHVRRTWPPVWIFFAQIIYFIVWKYSAAMHHLFSISMPPCQKKLDLCI